MEELLEKVRGLKPTDLDFEPLGDFIHSLNFEGLDYESYLPNDRSESEYCRKVLNEGPLECVLLFWPAKAESAIHFHQGFWGYVAVLQGCATNVDYHRVEDRLEEGITITATEGGVIAEPDGIIHKITNGSNSENLVTLHFYYPSISSFEGMEIYDLDEGRIGTLGATAKSASWQQPTECFDKIEENAFRFLSHRDRIGGKSHTIAPFLPKPNSQAIGQMLAGYYNEQASVYDHFVTQYQSRNLYTSRINKLIAEDVKAQGESISRKLAIACGTGRRELDIRNLIGLDYDIVGIDISHDMCQIAEKRGIKTQNTTWQEAILKEDDQFDFATFLYAFGHIDTSEKRLEVLKKVWRHLKPGGSFYFDVFNLDDTNEWGPKALTFFEELRLDRAGYEVGDIFYKKTGGDEIAYLHYFREEEVVTLLKNAGFDEVEVTHVGYVKYSGEIFHQHDKGSLFVKATKH